MIIELPPYRKPSARNILKHAWYHTKELLNENQSKEIGKELLNRIKEIYSELSLTVYEKNTKAVNFYQREQFIIKQEQIDENTGEIEYFMAWSK